jgi:diguanylate cyclase (GGDEF)-like protein
MYEMDKGTSISHSSEISLRDTLTGTYSRALFQDRLPDEIERARRYDSTLSLFLFDLDYFKTVNDAYGHSRGDQILKDVVRRVRLSIRSSDVLFRYGGDEFVILLPNTTKNQAVYLADRILEAIRSSPFPGDPPLTITISIGIATYPEDGKDADTIFQSADLRSYEAKRQGRNRYNFDSLQSVAGLIESPRLIERDEALDSFAQFLSKVHSTQHGLFIISGQSGTGRTRFLQEVSSLAALHNLFVLPIPISNGSIPTFKDTSQSALFDILRSNPISFPSLATFLEEHHQKGLFLTIDSVSDLEHTNQDLLRSLFSKENPVLTIVSYTTSPGNPRTLLRLNPPLTESVQLSPLSSDGVQVLLRSCLHWEPPEAFIPWIFHETAGLPKGILQGLDRLIRQGTLRGDPNGEWILSPNFASVDLTSWLSRPSIALHNLPAIVSDFLGREQDIKCVNHLLDSHRLVTLIGPGGIGKTRLALQVASMRLSDYSHGTFFVPLGNITDPNLLIPLIAQTLGIGESSDHSRWDSLTQYLKEKHLLLILDNFEQIVSASVFISELLQNAHRLYILVTSRQPLRLSGEHLFFVPPLEVPRDPTSLSLKDLEDFSAIALFISRAQASQPDFSLTDENSRFVIELCRHLEGLPLALELAAARINQYSPQEMVSQSSLALLARGPVDMPSRHQTIRSVIKWSVDLLSPEDKTLFACLGAFPAGFSIETAQQVCSPFFPTAIKIAESILTLTDQNLLRKSYVGDNQSRYSMLIPVQEFAVESLANLSFRSDLQRNTAEYFLSLAEKRDPRTSDLTQKEFLSILEEDHGNFSSVLEWALANDRILAARLSNALASFWEIHNHWSEARSILERLIPAALESIEVSINLYRWAGRFARLNGEYLRAEKILERGLALCEDTKYIPRSSALLQEMGWVVYSLGEPSLCREYFNRALEISRSSKDSLELSNALGNIGLLEERFSDFTESAQHFTESLNILRELDLKNETAIILGRLSRAHYYLGNYTLAEEEILQCIDLYQELGNQIGYAHSLFQLAEITRVSGDFTKVEALLQKSISIYRSAKDLEGMADSIRCLAEFYRSQQKYDEARRAYSQNLEIARSLGLKDVIVRSIKDLGEIARYQGNLDQADAYYNQALTLSKELGSLGDDTWIFRAMGELNLARGNTKAAKEFFRSSLTPRMEKSAIVLIPLVLSGCAGISILEKDYQKAAIILGSIEHSIKEYYPTIAIDDQKTYEARSTIVEENLTQSQLSKCLQEGRSLDLAQSIQFALGN